MKGRERRRDMFSLAGWLFADLFIVLAIIFVASTAMRLPPENALTPTPTVSKPVSLNPQPIDISVKMDVKRLLANDPITSSEIEMRVREQLSQQNATQLTAGLVLTFGGGTQDGKIAHAINALLSKMGGIFGSRTVYEDYIDLQALFGTAVIRIFVYR